VDNGNFNDNGSNNHDSNEEEPNKLSFADDGTTYNQYSDQTDPLNSSNSGIPSEKLEEQTPLGLTGPRLINGTSTSSRAPNPRVYSEQEVQLLYELGRLFLENGELRKAEVIFKGIVSVEPTYVAAWLGLAYLYHYSSQIDEGIAAAKKVVQLEPGSVEGSLFLVIFLYSSGEISTAGAILGEVREKVESGLVRDPNILRIYRSQLERFSSR